MIQVNGLQKKFQHFSKTRDEPRIEVTEESSPMLLENRVMTSKFASSHPNGANEYEVYENGASSFMAMRNQDMDTEPLNTEANDFDRENVETPKSQESQRRQQTQTDYKEVSADDNNTFINEYISEFIKQQYESVQPAEIMEETLELPDETLVEHIDDPVPRQVSVITPERASFLEHLE